MRNQVSDMCAHITALEQELQKMKALGDVSPRTADQVKAMETVIARMQNSVKDINKKIETEIVSFDLSNEVAEYMYADVKALEQKLKEIKGLGDHSPITANCLKAMEAVIVRMNNSVKDVDEVTSGLFQSHEDSGNANRTNTQGCFNWLIENMPTVFGCLGMSLGDSHHSAGENVAANIGGSEKKSFLEWLNQNELHQSDEEWKSALTRLKGEVIQKGIGLSYLLLDFIFLVSEGGHNMEIFEVLRDTLESTIQTDNKNHVVAERIFRFLEMIEKEVRNLRNKGEGSSKQGIRTDLIRQRKKFVDKIARYFCWQIKSLDTYVNKLLLTKSVLVKTMEESFGECETQLNKIEQEISELRQLVLSTDKQDAEIVMVLKRQLELRAVYELWSELGRI